MQLNFKSIDKTLVVSITGEIDHHTSETARDKIDSRLDSNPVKNLIFDFGGVTFMDSAGIGVILGRYKRITLLGGKIAIVNTRPQIKRILQVCGIAKIAGLYDGVNSALLHM